MDRHIPNHGIIAPDGSSYSSSGFSEYYPNSCYDNEYHDSPNNYYQQDMVYSNSNGACAALPDSPPDSGGRDLYSIPFAGHQGSPNYPTQVYATPSISGHNPSGMIPIPQKPAPGTNIHHPSFYGNAPPSGTNYNNVNVNNNNKRVRSSASGTGRSSVGSSVNSPMSSMGSFKQEDDLEFSLPPLGGVQTMNGQSYHVEDQSLFPGTGDDGHRNIEFKSIFQEQWVAIVDGEATSLSVTEFKVQADKGFNFSQMDEGFICQKKNHFQITFQSILSGVPQYIHLPSTGTVEDYKKITGFVVDLFGIKAESINQSIKIEQSQSDRTRKPFVPHSVATPQLTQQLSLGRLHFSETTANNMRKKGKPNPDQRFFKLVVALYADCMDPRTKTTQRYMVCAAASENIIVRASNPGQFESDLSSTPAWQRSDDESIYHSGKVGINTDQPQAELDVRGNIRLSGQLIQPSDARAKHIIEECDQRKQLENIGKLRIYRYRYKDEVAKALNLSESSMYDTGILAQEVLETIPEAVEMVGDLDLENGEILEDFLMVNKDRLFMENLGAVKELYNLTERFGSRIVELERMNRRVAHLKSRDSFRSNISAVSGKSLYSSASTVTASPRLPAGRSASARPSIYAMPTPRPSHQLEKPPRLTPKTMFGKNYIQWLTLGLVMLISVCLIAMLALYISSTSHNHNPASESLTTPAPQLIANQTDQSQTMGHVHLVESNSSIDYGISLATSTPKLVTDPTKSSKDLTSSTTSTPTGETFSPVVFPLDTIWQNLFATGDCSFIAPIGLDFRCLNATFAALECAPWDYATQCCRDPSSEPPHFPKYRTENQPLPSKDLHISFVSEEDEKKQHIIFNGETMKTFPNVGENLISFELDNGKAIRYQAASKAANGDLVPNIDEKKTFIKPNCSTPGTEEFAWPLLEEIRLLEPQVKLESPYCYSKGQPCGFNNTYIIAVPLSKQYSSPNMTVMFSRLPETVFVNCAYQIYGHGCFNRGSSTGVLKRVGEYQDTINIPVGNYAHSELVVRVAPKLVVQSLGLSSTNDLCSREHPDIFKYNLVFGRICK